MARHGFASTHWTTIQTCAGNDEAAHAARAELCRTYWYPIYAHIKRQGNQSHHAEDLTQDFFAYVLERPWFERADRSKGKFRSFLLGTINHFLNAESSRRNARRREGSYQHVPCDLGLLDDLQPVYEPPHVGIDSAFEAEWASAVVAASLQQLEEEHAAAGKSLIYAHLNSYLKAEGSVSGYEVTASKLSISVANVKVSVYRLRKRYAAILRERVATTVAAPEDVEDEMRYLHAILSAD